MLPRCGTLLTYGSALVINILRSPADTRVGFATGPCVGELESMQVTDRWHLALAAWDAVAQGQHHYNSPPQSFRYDSMQCARHSGF